jgi:hypothetical protein
LAKQGLSRADLRSLLEASVKSRDADCIFETLAALRRQNYTEQSDYEKAVEGLMGCGRVSSAIELLLQMQLADLPLSTAIRIIVASKASALDQNTRVFLYEQLPETERASLYLSVLPLLETQDDIADILRRSPAPLTANALVSFVEAFVRVRDSPNAHSCYRRILVRIIPASSMLRSCSCTDCICRSEQPTPN